MGLKRPPSPQSTAPEERFIGPDIIPVVPRSLARAGYTLLPTPIADAGAHAGKRFSEFFTANIRNTNTRFPYARAVYQSFDWCDDRDPRLQDLKPTHIAGYIERRPGGTPTAKQHLVAMQMLFDYLVTHGILSMNSASSVLGPKHVMKRGEAPVLTADQARLLLDPLQTSVIGDSVERPLILASETVH